MNDISNEVKISILELRNAKLEDELERCRKLLSESEQREAHAHAPAPQQPDAVGELLEACEPFEGWALTIPPEFEDSLLRDIYASCGDIRELARAASAVRAAGDEGGG